VGVIYPADYDAKFRKGELSEGCPYKWERLKGHAGSLCYVAISTRRMWVSLDSQYRKHELALWALTHCRMGINCLSSEKSLWHRKSLEACSSSIHWAQHPQHQACCTLTPMNDEVLINDYVSQLGACIDEESEWCWSCF